MEEQPIEVISTDRAPAAIGPYSQALRHGDTVWVSGQIALDPATEELVEGDAARQAEQCLRNLDAILQAAGSGIDKALKLTLYLTDLGDYASVNEAYARFFPDRAPARAAVEVSGLPKGVRIEIDAVAAV